MSLEGVAVSLEGRQLAPSMPILVDPDRRQHVLATHGHSHHRSTFLRRRCCPPTCQRHRHLPQLRQRAQRTAWTSLPGCRPAAASAMGTPAFSSGSELQGRSHGLHPHIVNGLALAHCSTSSHHHVWIGAVKRSHVRLSLHPRGPGSSPGRAEFFFILEFLVDGGVTNGALRGSNHCCC